MGMLTISDIILLKQELGEKYRTVLHYHDVCPKPFFFIGANRKRNTKRHNHVPEKERLYPSFFR